MTVPAGPLLALRRSHRVPDVPQCSARVKGRNGSPVSLAACGGSAVATGEVHATVLRRSENHGWFAMPRKAPGFTVLRWGDPRLGPGLGCGSPQRSPFWLPEG